jgi:hypothetical protein
MKRIIELSMCILAAAWALPAASAAPSVNGANVPASSPVVDQQGNTWSVVSGVVERNGIKVGYTANVALLLDLNNVFYQENTAGGWWEWTGTQWAQTTDPRVVSANGATIGVGTSMLVDSAKHVWSIPPGDIIYRDGIRSAAATTVVLALYYGGNVYCELSNGVWYLWSGSSWGKIAADPRGRNVAQYAIYNSPVCPANNPTCTPPFVGNSSVTFSKSTTKGNAIWVVATVSDYGGTHAITVTDSQNNTYHELNQGNDRAPGSQSVAQFYAGNIAGGADTITVNWGADNYKGILVAEIAGVKGSPLIANTVNIQDGGIAGGNSNITSDGMAVAAAQTPGLLVAVTMDTDGGGSDTGGTGFCAVPAGAGFTQIAQFWNWSPTGQPACNLATFESKVISGAGNYAGTFTTTHQSDPYVTVATVFQ